MSVDKSNALYYDIVTKWLNICYYSSNVDKQHTLYYNVVIKAYFIITLTVNIVLLLTN